MLPLSLALASTSMTPDNLKGEALLTDLSHRAVTYFWNEANPETGFVLDRAPNYPDAKRENGTISSIAATGYGLAAYCIGGDRHWLDRNQAKKRTLLVLNSVLTKHQGHNGWYYHFIDWKTGKRAWNSELSSIDSGLLFAGVEMAKGYWQDPEISKKCDEIMGRVQWKWFMTDGGKKPKELTFSMGWNPTEDDAAGKFLDARWNGFYESMFLYLVALGNSKDVPDASWKAFDRTIFEYKGIPLMNGGPLFIHQMSQAYFPMEGKRDNLGFDYWVEGRNMTLASRLYCKLNPKGFEGYSPDIWGLSACDVPGGYSAPGAPVPPGQEPNDDGTLAPASAVASVMYTPELSIKAAESFIEKYPESFGRYGFTTGINITKNWHSTHVIGIDIGQMMLAIEAHQNGHPYKWMLRNPRMVEGMRRAGFHKTNEGSLSSRPLKLNP